MYVTVSVVNPEEVRVAMTIEMSLKNWKEIKRSLAHETWQHVETHSIVWEIIESLNVATRRIETAIALQTPEERV